MNQKDIRWKQRFENFENSFLLLKQGLEIEMPSIFERAGIIQFFEMTFELSWKVLKDYLESLGVIAKAPRDVVKEAFRYEIITDGDAWMDMLSDRNLTVHTYDELKAKEVESKIKIVFFPAINHLYLLLKEKAR
ncbi:MAG: nucleotidyltransferase substrate binding protein [Kiritimatiellales bacterium]